MKTISCVKDSCQEVLNSSIYNIIDNNFKLSNNVASGQQQPQQKQLQKMPAKENSGSASQPGQSPKLQNANLVMLRDPARARASLYTSNRKR